MKRTVKSTGFPAASSEEQLARRSRETSSRKRASDLSLTKVIAFNMSGEREKERGGIALPVFATTNSGAESSVKRAMYYKSSSIELTEGRREGIYYLLGDH